MRKFKIPIKEATGEKNLEGNYLITFRLKNISAEDNIIITDIIEGIARTFEHSSALQKLANIDLEKTDADGIPLSQKPLKIGDSVRLIKDIKLKAELAEENGYYVIGSKTATNKLGEIEFTLFQDSQALINDMKDDQVELIDFDSAVVVPLMDEETELLENVTVNIDALTLKREDLDKIGE